ncbi:MAG: glucose-1-phosphate thymidylyltransferase [Thermodesulfobacteriota bacterium]
MLAGGHGTRLRPLTFTGNKHMLPIANKPMLFYGLEHMIKAGIKEIGIVLGPIKESVTETIDDGSKFGVAVTYIDQPEPKGLAHAVLAAEDFIADDDFVMYLGDNLLRQGIKPFVQLFSQNGCDCVIGVTHVKNPQMYGIVEMDDGKIIRLVEKPRDPKSNLALIGVYVFNHCIFDAAKAIKPSWRNELEITDAIQKLFVDGKKINVQRVEGWWKDTGKPADLLEANQLILQDLESTNNGIIDDGAKITGKVSIGDGTLINESAVLRGPIIIGKNCEIGPEVYIGPYTSIGDNCRIRGAELENSILMENVIINCNKRIIDSIVGRGSQITSAQDELPMGMRFIVGDSTYLSL